MVKRDKRNIGKLVRLTVRPPYAVRQGNYRYWTGTVTGFRGNAYFIDNNARKPVPQVLVKVTNGCKCEGRPTPPLREDRCKQSHGVFTFQGNNLEYI